MPPRPRSLLHARIGTRVRNLRREKGWTQAYLAGRLNCSNHFISGIERGVDSPSLMTLEALAQTLGTSVAALVCEDEVNSPGEFVYDLAVRLKGKEDARLCRVLRDVIELYEPKKA